jgi:transposase/prophage regulatory protein
VAPSPLTRTTAATDQGASQKASSSPYDSLIDLKEVCRRTGLGRSSIGNLVARGTFPKRVKVTDRSTRWSARAVEAWIQERIAAATGPGR